MGKGDVTWKRSPEDVDYKAASDFLNLLCAAAAARKLIGALRKASTIEQSAKDLLRAGNLPLLEKGDPHVEDDLDKIHKGKPLARFCSFAAILRKARPWLLRMAIIASALSGISMKMLASVAGW